jgi:hypothetical protein
MIMLEILVIESEEYRFLISCLVVCSTIQHISMHYSIYIQIFALFIIPRPSGSVLPHPIPYKIDGGAILGVILRNGAEIGYPGQNDNTSG